MSPRDESPIRCRRIPNGIIAVKVSARKYRLAQVTRDGTGFVMGLTNLVEVEFITEPLTFGEMLTEMSAHANELGYWQDFKFTLDAKQPEKEKRG